MGLVVAGPPKAGTSALRALVEQMGLERLPGTVVWNEYRWRPRSEVPEGEPAGVAWDMLKEGQFVHAHVPPGAWLDKHQALVVLRDPRANVVSWWRAKWHARLSSERARGTWTADPTPQQLDSFHRWVRKRGGGIRRAISYIKPIHAGWLNEGHPHCLVWYENLRTISTLEEIADFIGAPIPDVKTFYGKTSKWTGRPTVWEEWFTDELEEVFWECWERSKDAEPLRS